VRARTTQAEVEYESFLFLCLCLCFSQLRTRCCKNKHKRTFAILFHCIEDLLNIKLGNYLFCGCTGANACVVDILTIRPYACVCANDIVKTRLSLIVNLTVFNVKIKLFSQ